MGSTSAVWRHVRDVGVILLLGFVYVVALTFGTAAATAVEKSRSVASAGGSVTRRLGRSVRSVR